MIINILKRRLCVASAGTIIHTITQQNLHADYYYVNNVYDTTLSHFCGAAFDVKPGAHTLQTGQCTSDYQLFFQLGSTADPLKVSGGALHG